MYVGDLWIERRDTSVILGLNPCLTSVSVASSPLERLAGLRADEARRRGHACPSSFRGCHRSSKAQLDVVVDGKGAVVRFGNDAPGCAAPVLVGCERTSRTAFGGLHHARMGERWRLTAPLSAGNRFARRGRACMKFLPVGIESADRSRRGRPRCSLRQPISSAHIRFGISSLRHSEVRSAKRTRPRSTLQCCFLHRSAHGVPPRPVKFGLQPSHFRVRLLERWRC
ncbi:hypothetical protein RHECNPAF_14110018 [Rhizobium etli CNPAF512]|nr:hypothetical protein RHECNPAF_14110018 [Rhizobium etli CNPAF512]